MKFFSANLRDLRELYNNSLQKALDMEHQIVKALPTMIEKSTDPDLKQALQSHLQETEGHVASLEHILRDTLGEPKTLKCKVLSSLVSEAEDSVKDAADPSVRDASLIAAAQQVEHHEIAVYGTLLTWAAILDETEQASDLTAILEQEKNADLMLTGIASRVNEEADAAPISHAA
jgi:ferritin-like metal-binding protein YciE